MTTRSELAARLAELERESQAGWRALKEWRRREGRGATDEQLAPLRRLLEEITELQRRLYDLAGPVYEYGYNPPTFPEAEWNRHAEAARKPPPGATYRAKYLEPPPAAMRYELVNGPLADGVEVDPESDPDPLEESLFDAVIGRIGDGELSLREIARETGASDRQVLKIRDYRDHPNRLGPNGRAGYALYRADSGRINVAMVALRKLRAQAKTV